MTLSMSRKKFINDLNTLCEATKVPFMAGDMPDDFVNRPDKVNEAISYLIDRQSDGVSVPCNVVLHGPGGFGKTTLLKAICHNEENKMHSMMAPFG
jgi:Holliday junction resolvasome RuvABC ATP-dependent DNA helicase subunit